MLLDRKNNPWIAACLGLLAVALGLYGVYHRTSLNGPSGGSWPGLAFGIVGFLLIVFVGLLGARRQVPAWRIGRAEAWMRGHVWLGLLAFTLILFHSGFHFGGALTTALMVMLIVLTASGIVGLILQQIVPRMMTSQVPMETIYEQIDHVIGQLQAEAETHVEAVTGPIEDDATGEAFKPPVAADVGTLAAPAKVSVPKGRPARPWSEIPDTAMRPAVAASPASKEGGPLLKDFYVQQVRPYLKGERSGGPLSNASRAAAYFAGVQTLLPPPMHETVADLEEVCEEYRQLRHQQRLQLWLHAWLLVHIPLSYAFLALVVVHIVTSVSY